MLTKIRLDTIILVIIYLPIVLYLDMMIWSHLSFTGGDFGKILENGIIALITLGLTLLAIGILMSEPE
jgi:uncharacterized membrane protein